MESVINEVNKSGVRIEPWVFQDASFKDIVHEALYYTQTRPFDLIFVGRISTTGGYYFPWTSCERLILHMQDMIRESDKRLQKERPATKIIYCPIMGVDLGKVLQREATQEQLILNEGIWATNLLFYELNNARGHYCPNLVLPVHRIINKKRKNYYQHLADDGITLTTELRRRWASEMLKTADPNKPFCKEICNSWPEDKNKD